MTDTERLDQLENYILHGGELGFWFYQNYFRITDGDTNPLTKRNNFTCRFGFSL